MRDRRRFVDGGVDGGGALLASLRTSRTTEAVVLADEDVAQQVDERVALRPTEVTVGATVGHVAQVEEHGAGVRHNVASRAQHPVSAQLDAGYLEHLIVELRGVDHVYF